jgi:hypothetical protein
VRRTVSAPIVTLLPLAMNTVVVDDGDQFRFAEQPDLRHRPFNQLAQEVAHQRSGEIVDGDDGLRAQRGR